MGLMPALRCCWENKIKGHKCPTQCLENNKCSISAPQLLSPFLLHQRGDKWAGFRRMSRSSQTKPNNKSPTGKEAFQQKTRGDLLLKVEGDLWGCYPSQQSQQCFSISFTVFRKASSLTSVICQLTCTTSLLKRYLSPHCNQTVLGLYEGRGGIC